MLTTKHIKKCLFFLFFFTETSPGAVSPTRREQPLFTLKQVGMLCERLLKEREDKVREEYEEIMTSKLAGLCYIICLRINKTTRTGMCDSKDSKDLVGSEKAVCATREKKLFPIVSLIIIGHRLVACFCWKIQLDVFNSSTDLGSAYALNVRQTALLNTWTELVNIVQWWVTRTLLPIKSSGGYCSQHSAVIK